MHIYSNIIMHSLQNPNYICFFLNLERKKKQLATWHIDTWRTYGHVSKFQMATHIGTSGHMAA
jgi:hypothetical protein